MTNLEKATRTLSAFTTKGASPKNFQFNKIDDSRFLIHDHGCWWMVWDNGGEAGVEKLNSGELARFVPLEDRFGVVNFATVAFRMAQVLAGEEINFERRIEDSVFEPAGHFAA